MSRDAFDPPGAMETAERERVVLFPTFGYPIELDGEAMWAVPIHGWVYSDVSGRRARELAMRVARRSLGLKRDEVSGDLFFERARNFVVDNVARRRITVTMVGRRFAMNLTGKNGHFTGLVYLTADEVAAYQAGGGAARVTVASDRCRTPTRLPLHEATGPAVISDIDDTIKVSDVGRKRELLANTFTLPYRPITGLAAVYQRWASAGATFHYVSSTPWQLCGALREFLVEAGYPAGSMHLKNFRWKDRSFFSLFASPKKTKRKAIEPILAALPGRRFVLVGDAGEKDPEIYAELARAYPEQITRVLIRWTGGAAVDTDRMHAAFVGVAREKWMLFHEVSELGGVDVALG